MINRYRWIAVPLLLALALIGLAGCGGKQATVAPVVPRATEAAVAQPAAQISGTLEGVVVDAVTGKPLDKVVIKTNPGTAGATTDAQGKFTIKDVPLGIYNVQATLDGYDVAFQGNLSIVAGGAQTLQLALRPSEEYPLADIRAVWPSDGEVYPDQKVWITLHAGYASHNNEKIVTTGLNNVAVGTYVYLAGREQDAAGKPISGWTWKVTGPSGEDVPVENGDTRTPRFLAAKEGKYQVTVQANLDGGKKGTTVLTVNAGHYVGAEACQSCHNGSVRPDVYSAWLGTGHATKFETTFSQYAADRDYCIGCHTTGYNETDTAGGFDDLARQAGWDPQQGSVTAWLLGAKKTVDQIKASPMGKLTSVQCESCHGPGSAHTGASSYDPGVCEQCHEQGLQWATSGHALTGYKNSHTAGNAACAPCHSGDGFVVAKVRKQQPVFPSQATPLQPANIAAPGESPMIGCATCHDPHQASEPDKNGASAQLRLHGAVTIPIGVTIQAGDAAVCVSCHANNRDAQYKQDYQAGKKIRATHENPQVDVLFGVKESAFDFGESLAGPSAHADNPNACLTCHMAPNPVLDPGPDGKPGTRDDVTAKNIGGHSWAMAGKVTVNGQEKDLQNTAACQASGCHAEGSIQDFDREARADYDGDGKVEGIQDEVKGLLELLAAKLPKDDKGQVLSETIKADNTTEVEREAIWNYDLILRDGSYGVHNAAFTIQLLQKTYQHLTGQPVPNATLR